MRCQYHCGNVVLWKRVFLGVKVVKRKKLTKKKLVPEEKKGRRRWSSPFLSCKYWMLYTYYIYIIYMLCMLQHLWGLFSYFFCLFNGTVNSLVKSWFFFVYFYVYLVVCVPICCNSLQPAAPCSCIYTCNKMYVWKSLVWFCKRYWTWI